MPGSSFTNGPLLGSRADAALQYLMTLPPLNFSSDKVANIKVHSLKPFMLKHAARMRIDPVRRHGLGRFAGSAAQHQSLIPDQELLVRHRIRCSQLPNRYAQNAAMALDTSTALRVSRDIQRLVGLHSIHELAAMEWDGALVDDDEDSGDTDATHSL